MTPEFPQRTAMRPKAVTWAKHIGLLLLTFVTSTIAGVLAPFGLIQFGSDVEAETFAEILALIPTIPLAYLNLVTGTIGLLASNGELLAYGLSFSASLLFILIAHELGHYIACRIYGVDATLPYFLPVPPLIGPAGTLGAFIRIVSPMPSRRAVFDIGVAGPIAGFVALLPVAIIMVLTLKTAPPVPVTAETSQIIFFDPLLIKILAWLQGIDLSQPIYPNPFYGATWIGLLVTALNLIPSGQLDGGHAVFAVFGERIHRWTGRIAFVLMAFMSVLGLYLYNSPSGFLFAIILAVMLKIRHPKPLDTTPLDKKRIAIAILTLLIFVLCFVPIPLELT
ncbi:MAG: site-2 protease family protein [Pyrinomonadaceae bacterium]|nr:site-2 protease family protein [Pyrinomonadaceae bacterium]